MSDQKAQQECCLLDALEELDQLKVDNEQQKQKVIDSLFSYLVEDIENSIVNICTMYGLDIEWVANERRYNVTSVRNNMKFEGSYLGEDCSDLSDLVVFGIAYTSHLIECNQDDVLQLTPEMLGLITEKLAAAGYITKHKNILCYIEIPGWNFNCLYDKQLKKYVFNWVNRPTF